MPSAVVTQGLPLRVLRKKFTVGELIAAEVELFGAVPTVPCKGYGTARAWIGATAQAGTLRFYTRPEKNVAAGSTSYTFTLVSSQVIPAGPSNQPTPVNLNADHLRVTWQSAVATAAEIEITLVP